MIDKMPNTSGGVKFTPLRMLEIEIIDGYILATINFHMKNFSSPVNRKS